jgi:VWFA-related protein
VKRSRQRECEKAGARRKLLRAAARRAWLLVLCWLLCGEAFAQSGRRPQKPPNDPAEKPDLRLETREVRVPLRAWDAAGKPVTNLTPKDVLVLEEGGARPVTSIKHERANIVLVLDLSNEIGTFKNGESQRERLWGRPSREVLPRPAAREFADRLVEQLPAGDRIAIIQYADRVQLIQDWTEDRDEALLSLRSKFRAGIRARYFDALMLAVQTLGECESGRRVVVLVSDGIDSASKARASQAMTALARAQASVFVVSWTELLRREIRKALEWSGAHEAQNSATYKRGVELATFMRRLDGPEAELERLAEQSGGELWIPDSFDKLTKSAPAEIIREIGAQYTLTFVAEREGLDSLRAVQVLPARAGLTVRSRRRYYVEDGGQ